MHDTVFKLHDTLGYFFALVLFFSLRAGNITLWIGKIINPIFLIFLAVLVISALIHPGTAASAIELADVYKNGALFSALAEGYGTMDVICSGILTGVLMALIYILTILMGARSRSLFETSENGGIALAQIAGHYLGNAGNVILAVTITFACLKTSIGLVTSCSETFVRMFPEKLSYRIWAVIFTLFSFCISNIGLSAIINYSVPVLMLIYPPAISLILLALCGKLFDHDRSIYLCVTVFTWSAAVFDFFKTLPANVRMFLYLDQAVDVARNIFPFFDLNLGWILPAAIGLVIGILIRWKRSVYSERRE